MTKQKQKLSRESTSSQSNERTSEQPAAAEIASSKPAKEKNKAKKKAKDGGASGEGKVGGKPSSVKSEAVQHSEVSSTSSANQASKRKPVTSQDVLRDYVQRQQMLFEPEGLCFYREVHVGSI